MGLHVVVGKGPVGTATAQELVRAGHRVRVLSRSGGTSTADVEHRAVDAADAGALAAAAEGADALVNAVNPAYPRWATDWPPMAAAMLDAATRTGAVLVAMGNLYVHGRPTGPMTATTPLAATDTKGRVRAGCGPTCSPRTRPAGCRSWRPAPRTSSARRCRPRSPTSPGS